MFIVTGSRWLRPQSGRIEFLFARTGSKNGGSRSPDVDIQGCRDQNCIRALVVRCLLSVGTSHVLHRISDDHRKLKVLGADLPGRDFVRIHGTQTSSSVSCCMMGQVWRWMSAEVPGSLAGGKLALVLMPWMMWTRVSMSCSGNRPSGPRELWSENGGS
jgi:hypothetical protein